MRLETLILLLAGSLPLVTGCERPSSVATASAPIAPACVQVAVVERIVAPTPIKITGTVRPAERAVIAAKITGVIASPAVALGQVVKHGDLLIRLAAPELAARLVQARAQLEQAAREERRDRGLAATGADSADTARAAVERLRAVQAAVDEAESMLAYTEIRAPYDGRVTQKLAYPGDLATPGEPLLVVEASAAFQVETAVPASLIPSLTCGARLDVRIADIAESFHCTVEEISGAADPATRTVLVKLALPAGEPALSGRAATVEIPGPPAEQLLVPASALTSLGQMERVFIVAEGRAQLRLVRTGATRTDRTEILAGVTGGERVILAPPPALRDGQPVLLAP